MTDRPDAPRHPPFHLTAWIVRIVFSGLILAFAAWGAAAIAYQAPGAPWMRDVVAAVWAIVFLGLFYAFAVRRQRFAALVAAGLIGLLVAWWGMIPASNSRDWADDVARMAAGVVNGREVTLANVRNFDWRSDTDYTVRWENRTYNLDALASVDLFLSYWSSPAIAHTLISFGFADGTFVTFSVEIRRERQESFSEIGGFFKEFEMSVIAADERDIVRVRTNVRNEDVYLYRINLPKADIQSLFLAYVDQANRLTETPQFYNTITANCTTIVYEMVRRIVPDLPLDYRLILSGYLPEYIDKLHGFTPGFTLDELRRRGAISAKAKAAGMAPDFSRRIREGVPGIADQPKP